MAESSATVYFELDAKSSKFISELQKATASWEKTHKEMQRSAKASSDAVKSSGYNISQSMNKVGGSADLMARSWGRAMQAVTSAALAAGVALGTREIVQYADAWIQTSNRLRVVVKDSGELAAKQKELFAVAQDTAENYKVVVNVYAAVTQALAASGQQSDKTTEAVRALADAAEISGVGFDDVEGKIVKFARGLADGSANVKEFQTILLTVPRAAQAIADALGLPIDKVKALAKDGKIGAKQIVEGLASQAPALRAEASVIVDDFAKIGNRINNELTKTLGAPLSGVLLTSARLAEGGFVDLLNTVGSMKNTIAVVGAVGVTAATAMAAAWKVFIGTLTGIEIILTFIEAGYRRIIGEKPFESAAQDIRRATADAERLNKQLTGLGDAPGNATAVTRINRELAEANATLARLDPTGKVAGLISAYDQLQRRIAAVSKDILPSDGAIQNTIGQLKLIESEIAVVNNKIKTSSGDTLDELNARLASLTSKKVELEVVVKRDAKGLGRANFLGELESLRESAKKLRDDMKGLGIDIDARGAKTALGETETRLNALLVKMDELTDTQKLLTPEQLIARVKALGDELNAVGGGAAVAKGGISGIVEELNKFNPEQFKIGASIGLARDRELERSATFEINRSIISGEQSFSAELRAILDAQVNAKVGAEKILAQQSAARTGKKFDEKTFDEEGRKVTAFVQLYEQAVDKIEGGRNKIREGGSLIPLGLGAEQFDQVLTQVTEAEAIIAANKVESELAVNQAILDGKTVLNAELIELARQQAMDETIAAFEAKQAALGELGQAATPDEEAANRQAAQELALRRAAEMQARLTGAEIKGVSARKKLALEEAQLKIQLAQQVAGNAISFLQTIGGESKAAAIAIIAIDKGLAIAQTIAATQTAMMKVRAAYPGPVGEVWAARYLAAGAASVALIAATGLGQVANVGSGGGGGAAGVISGTGAGSEPPPQLGGFDPESGRNANNQVTINFNGDMVGWDAAMRDNLLDAIRDAVDGRDVVLFSGNSRQAVEIRGGG